MHKMEQSWFKSSSAELEATMLHSHLLYSLQQYCISNSFYSITDFKMISTSLSCSANAAVAYLRFHKPHMNPFTHLQALSLVGVIIIIPPKASLCLAWIQPSCTKLKCVHSLNMDSCILKYFLQYNELIYLFFAKWKLSSVIQHFKYYSVNHMHS